jgi:hypothetical protein
LLTKVRAIIAGLFRSFAAAWRSFPFILLPVYMTAQVFVQFLSEAWNALT